MIEPREFLRKRRDELAEEVDNLPAYATSRIAAYNELIGLYNKAIALLQGASM